MSDSSHFIDLTSQVHELHSGSESCTAACLVSAKWEGSPAALAAQKRAESPSQKLMCTILSRIDAKNTPHARHLTSGSQSTSLATGPDGQMLYRLGRGRPGVASVEQGAYHCDSGLASSFQLSSLHIDVFMILRLCLKVTGSGQKSFLLQEQRGAKNAFIAGHLQHSRPKRSPIAQAMSSSLWAFDFDGVVCNSVGESSKSAWKVGRRHF